MAVIYVDTFINHIISSNKFRERFKDDILDKFSTFYKEDNDTILYKPKNIGELFNALLETDIFNNEFKDAIYDEYKILYGREEFMNSYLSGSNNNIYPSYFREIIENYEIKIDELTINKVYEIWDNNMTNKERSLWIEPEEEDDIYLLWKRKYRKMVLEYYPNSSRKELENMMNKLWNTSIKDNVRCAELRKYSDRIPYIEYENIEIEEAIKVNRTMIKFYLYKHKRALSTIKKYIRMIKFLRLCKSERFNDYFWREENMGGKWNKNRKL